MAKNLLYKALAVVLVMLVSAGSAFAQKRTVRGVVSDSEGPMTGVSVVLRDPPPTGVSTAPDGTFELTVPNNEAVLIFSFLGYREVEIPVGTQTEINVVMEPEVELVDEVVVIGYGTQMKSHLTGSISKLDGEAIVNRPASDLTTALQGQIAGLQVNNITSEVGAAAVLGTIVSTLLIPYLTQVDLADFLSEWVAVTERVRFDYGGSYSLRIVRISDGRELLRIDDRTLDLWRTGTTGLRPKWGIYRSIGDAGSLKSALRDEIVRFADFEIEKP